MKSVMNNTEEIIDRIQEVIKETKKNREEDAVVDSKRYGFITPDNVEKDVFVHPNSVAKKILLTKRQWVKSNIIKGRKGLDAGDVEIVE